MNKWYKTLSIYALIFLFVIVMAYFFMDSQSGKEIKEVEFSEFVTELQNENVKELTLQETSMQGTLKDGSIIHAYAPSSLQLMVIDNDLIMPQVYDGKLVVYDEAYMESQQPVDTITITPANDFEYRDEGTNAYGSAEAVNGGLIGTFTAPSGGDKVLRRILPFRMTDQSEADRFAKGLLRDANKNATVGTLWTGSLLRDYAAGSVVTLATEGVKSWDGTAFISLIRHDYVKTRSKLYLRKPLEGY